MVTWQAAFFFTRYQREGCSVCVGGGVTEGVAESINTGRTRFEDYKESALMTCVTLEDNIKNDLQEMLICFCPT
jgi:hypothetical protein